MQELNPLIDNWKLVSLRMIVDGVEAARCLRIEPEGLPDLDP
jgi:hypothetical protein